MLRRLSFSSLIAVLASLLMAALLPLTSAGLSASHAPVGSRIAGAGAPAASGADQDAALHEHAAVIEGESRVRHQHAHSASDHSHDSPFSPPEPEVVAGGHEALWQPGAHARRTGAVLAVPERPPKPAEA